MKFHRFQAGLGVLSLGMLLLIFVPASGEDWPQFRGGSASAAGSEAKLPTTWRDSENLQWKTELPGPGSSSPIVQRDRIFLTCYSGYGVPKQAGGEQASLKRHLVCIDRTTGKISWSKTIAAEMPEDNYQGFISEHGYASNTPVTDGQSVFCFFGKSGVIAFDMQGKQLWKVNVGKESSNRRWGSAASLILHKNMVIVNASEESQSIRALDKSNGKEIWNAPAAALELAYGTPVLVPLPGNRTDLVIAVPGEVWGLDPDTGKLRWHAEHQLTGNICPSVMVDGDMLYVFGGFRSSGSFAMRAGGEGNVTKTHILWTSRNSSYVATPVLHAGHLYWIDDRGQAYCISAKTGETIYRERVAGLDSGGRPVYASPILADGKIYIPSRWSGTLVLAPQPEYKILAQNRFSDDDSDCNASVAISQGQIFIRSNRYLYCVANTAK